jgi:O-antigen/teichoic acid export membrane protein
MRNPFALIKSEFIRSVAILMSGNLFAQVITVAVTPIVTRIYSPEEFGLFALFMAIIGVCSQISSLCYERAALLPKDESMAEAVLILSILVLLGFVLLIGLVCLFFGAEIANILGNRELESWMLMVPVGVFVTGSINILNYWALRRKQFRLMSGSRVLEAVGAAIIKIALGFLIGGWSGGLLLGAMFGSIISLVVLYHYLGLCFGVLRDTWVSRQVISEVAAEYRQFPMYASWNALLTVSSRYIPVFILSALFGPAAVGFFNLASRMLTQPIAAISNSVSRVYFQKSASQLAESKSITSDLLKLLLSLFLLGVIPFSLLAIFAVEIFTFVFGEMWQVAGFYAQIMTPWFFLMFVRAPAGIVFEVCQRQRQKLIITFVNAIGSIAVMLGFYFNGASTATVIGVFVAVNTVMSVVQVMLAVKIARDKDLGLLTLSVD